ncbi:response regulator of the LytR/AlgR family [Desulfosporosinus orientis DSM 765]|uniref:Stage 0 sporulation protein A homolog n=1 Tax=Desulfosporosinus orientis (strain ATCC 19365 / DSM 765 / NCIMB 8382 / VKM B-1628 / Singapore I) TaxID=768706 RepID=G7W796_DESOD|nr:response regulator [Desulfosporosinus orientis]AET70604.1 response regulator of the LytR/AlgR family [Desulfosporosinus orientis DSM 765]
MLNIEICDDRPLPRKLLEILLRQYEEEKGGVFEICQFGSGEELLEELDQHHRTFDLVFLDNSMKKLTGLETAMQIRQSASPSKCRIVFVTSAEDHKQFMPVQPLQVIAKPCSQELIDAILDRVLGKKTLQKT